MYVLVDIGGTKTRIAETRDLVSFGTPLIVDTPKERAEIAAYVAKIVRRMAGGESIERAAVGIVSPWQVVRDHSFQKEFSSRINAPVTLENDAALVGLGEAHFGAGRGSRIFVYLTVSTGLNGARIVEGRVDPSTQGFEIGGQYLSTEGTTSLEELISGHAVEKHYGVYPKELGKDHPVWEEEARLLAYGVHNTLLHWSPDRVALGGSMMNEIGIPIPRVEAHLRDVMRKFPSIPPLVHAELGELGGLWGSLALLRQITRGSASGDTFL